MTTEQRSRWGTDATGLAICGVATIARGVSYLPGMVNPDRNPAHYLEGVFSPYLWGVIWIIVGVLCLAAIWVPTLMPTGLGLIVGIHAAWGTSFLAGQFFDDALPRAWVSALSYYLVCALVLWAFGRGRSAEIRVIREE